MGCPCSSAGEYLRRSSASMTALSMKGRLFITRQLRTWPCTETMHLTSMVPWTSCSSAWFEYTGSGPPSFCGGVSVSVNPPGPPGPAVLPADLAAHHAADDATHHAAFH